MRKVYALNGFALAARHVVQSARSRDGNGGANGWEVSSRIRVFPTITSGRKAGRTAGGVSVSIASA